MQPIIAENREKIIELCRTHHVLRLSVFGSVVRDDFNPETIDIDVLGPEARPIPAWGGAPGYDPDKEPEGRRPDL